MRKHIGKTTIAAILSIVMLMSMLPLYAFAVENDEHQHTEFCYAQAGDLLCDMQESEGHSHEEACYCPGGEYICDLVETEGHAHDDSCYLEADEYEVASDSEAQEKQLICEMEETEGHLHSDECICSGGELVCELEEAEGHAHSEGCYAEGTELICTYEETDDEPKAVSSDSEYDYIKELLINDENIEFDPETQTFIVLDVLTEQSAHMQELNVYNAEENIQKDPIGFDVYINGEEIPYGTKYYLVSEDNSIEAVTTTWQNRTMNVPGGKLGVFIVNKEDSYKVAQNSRGFYYEDSTWSDENNNFYPGDFVYFPKNGQLCNEYSGTAGDDIIETEFFFVCDWCIWLDFEILIADPETKSLDNPGFINADIDGYINFKFEIRDQDGNISLLPKTFYNNYGSDDEFIYMDQDGVVSIPLETYNDELSYSTPYGEFDIYIPFGCDYRITLLDYSVDTLGGYAYVTSQEHGHDADDFYLPDHTGAYEWGNFFQVNFMPCTQEIKVEKTVEGNAPEDIDYTFQATQNIYSFVDDSNYITRPAPDLKQLLIGYPYELYDSVTNEKLNAETLKTDKNGYFTLKAGQYAVFKVWELPADIEEYEYWGYNFIDDVWKVNSDVATESKYIFEEIDAGDCETTITHVVDGTASQIDGKKVENVYGGDTILFKNVYPTAKIYPITYLSGTADTVTNMPENDTFTPGDAYTVSDVIPQREGFEFIEWVLEKETERTYRVTYDLNGGYGTLPVDETEYRAGDMVTVTEEYRIEIEKGWFSGYWSKEPLPMQDPLSFMGEGCYEVGKSYEMGNEDLTLYAVYIGRMD